MNVEFPIGFFDNAVRDCWLDWKPDKKYYYRGKLIHVNRLGIPANITYYGFYFKKELQLFRSKKEAHAAINKIKFAEKLRKLTNVK